MSEDPIRPRHTVKRNTSKSQSLYSSKIEIHLSSIVRIRERKLSAMTLGRFSFVKKSNFLKAELQAAPIPGLTQQVLKSEEISSLLR